MSRPRSGREQRVNESRTGQVGVVPPNERVEEDPLKEPEDEAWLYWRRFLSLGLQCLSIVLWGIVQFVLALVDANVVPHDALTQATFFVFLLLEAASTLCWTGIHAYRELRLYLIDVQTDIQLKQQVAQRRIRHAADHQEMLPSHDAEELDS